MIILRPWTLMDIPDLLEHVNNWNVAQYLRDESMYPMTQEYAKKYIMSNTHQGPGTRFAIDLDGKAIGHVEIHLQTGVYRKSAELGCWVGEPNWGKGVASKAVLYMLTHAFTKFDLMTIYSRIFDSNAASKRLVERLGFQLDGKLQMAVYHSGAFQDELYYTMTRNQFYKSHRSWLEQY